MAEKSKKIMFVAVFVPVLVLVCLLLGFVDAQKITDIKAIEAKEKAAVKEWLAYNNMIKQADTLYQGYFYEEAEELLQNGKYKERDEVKQKIENCKLAQANLVEYNGTVEHVFFHSLIFYPELAFDGDHMAEGYDLWMTTADEFKKMLPQLRDRGYVLYNIEDLIEQDPNDPNKIVRKAIYLPEGKKPLILSVDDVNYYDYMQKDGFAKRLVLDEDGEVATLVKNPEGIEEINRNGDVVPILDDFVKEYPDFSFRGAKGILALTGYAGALGYRITDVSGDDYKALRTKMDSVVAKLKQTGWIFACHSYTHNSYFKNYTITMQQMQDDATRWRDTIGAVVGQTNIYISPFGVSYKNNDPLYRYLVKQKKFNIFCSVAAKASLIKNDDNIIMSRINLDGFSMKNHKEMLKQRFFNVDDVIDVRRPKT